MRVNIIGKANGVGLTRDSHLLADALRVCDCEVTISAVGSKESGRRKSTFRKLLRSIGLTRLSKRQPSYDINIMLEHVWTQFAQDARVNVVVPNPDYFDTHDVAALPYVNRVWAKTVNTQQIFQRLDAAVTWTGFDSEDRLDPSCARERTFFHLAGSSSLKGTARLLQVWARHPEWPLLIVVGRLKPPVPSALNIKVIDGYLDDAQLKRLQNESAVHVCTSEAEGWGHYLAEGLSVGAAVITVDAPPMNELVTDRRGLLLSCKPAGLHRLAQRYAFDEASMEALVPRIVSMSLHELTALGHEARRWFLDNKTGFHGRVKRALHESGV